jgi:hypothetical protein
MIVSYRLDAAADLADLAGLPGNRLEALEAIVLDSFQSG